MSDKVGSMSEPANLLPLKKRRTFLEATVSPSLSSQQDLDSEMANEQYLLSFSQQDESIELRHQGSGTLYRVKHTLITHNGRKHYNRGTRGHSVRRAHHIGYSAYHS